MPIAAGLVVSACVGDGDPPPIVEAIYAGDSARVSQLLRGGVNPSGSWEGVRYADYAIWSLNPETIAALVRAGLLPSDDWSGEDYFAVIELDWDLPEEERPSPRPLTTEQVAMVNAMLELGFPVCLPSGSDMEQVSESVRFRGTSMGGPELLERIERAEADCSDR